MIKFNMKASNETLKNIIARLFFTTSFVLACIFSLGKSSDQIIFSGTMGELLHLDYGSGFSPADTSMVLIDAAIELCGNKNYIWLRPARAASFQS